MMNEEVDLTEDEFDARAAAGKPAMVITGKAEVEKFLNENSPRDSRYLTGYKAGYKDARTELGKEAPPMEEMGATSRAYNLGYKVGTIATRREADENMKNMVSLCEKYESELQGLVSALTRGIEAFHRGTHVINFQNETIAKATQVVARYRLAFNRWMGADIDGLWDECTPEEREAWRENANKVIHDEVVS